MFLVKASIVRPIAMTTLIICLLVFGILAYRNVGVDMMPAIDLPYITTVVVYPGASPDEIETTVAKKIEDAVVQVDGIKHMTTTCLNNYCQVMLEFELNRDADVCAADVRDKIALIRGELPAGIEEPKTLKFDVNATPVVTIALTGDQDIDALYDYADNTLADRFASLAGVASVEKIGGMEREVIINLDRDKLAVRGLSAVHILQAVGQENRKIPVGQIDDGGREVSLMFDAEAERIDALGDIEVGMVWGERVYLRDVATFTFGTERVKSRASYDGQPCVILKVTKKGEANAVDVVNRVQKVYTEVAQTLPGGMKLVWFRDDGTFINAQVQDGMSNIWQGIVLTGFILILFLADIRMAFVAFVSIPVTMIISIMCFTWFGYTMNVSTLCAFGISVGILVTNSIVVLESIAAGFLKHTGAIDFDLGDTVEKSASAVGLAVAASALTNVVVFLPIASMQSAAGKFIAPFAMTVASATFVSLLVSFTLTPILAKVCFPYGQRVNGLLQRLLTPWTLFFKGMTRAYVRSLMWAMKAPLLVILVMAVVGGLGLWRLLGTVQSDFMPEIDKGDLSIHLEFPADYNLDHSETLARELSESIRRDPGVTHVAVQVGKVQGMVGQASEGSYLAEIDVRMLDKNKRPPQCSLAEVKERLRKLLETLPDCKASVLTPLVVGGTGQQIQLFISGNDFDVLHSVGRAIANDLIADGCATDIETSIRPGRPEVRFRPNRAVLHDLGVSAATVGTALRTAIAGVKQTTFKRGDRSYDIRVRYAQEPGVDQIPALNLPGPEGLPVPIGAVTTMTDILQPTQILRFSKVRSIVIYANPAVGVGMATTVARLNTIVKKHLPMGYTASYAGMSELFTEAANEFTLVMIVAIVLTYLLLAAILESWLQPLIILFTVPFAYLGLYFALHLTGQNASIFSMLAGVMLIGVVVNAAILLMDDVNTRRQKQNTEPRQALLFAAEHEFRPIVMSCLAALFGMLPMAFGTGLGSEIRAGIGVGSVGGILVSSIFSLYFIPALYVAVACRKQRRATRV